jgi:hypothetical protein
MWGKTKIAFEQGRLSFVTKDVDINNLIKVWTETISEPAFILALENVDFREDEIFIERCGDSEYPRKMILTNQRLIIRNNNGFFDVYELFDITSYNLKNKGGWFISSFIITLYFLDGTTKVYSEYGNAIDLDNFLSAKLMAHDISKNKSANQNNSDFFKQNNTLTLKVCLEILCIEGEITKDKVIRKWYELSSQYHPDKVQHLGEKLKILADNEIKKINAAYKFICDYYGF